MSIICPPEGPLDTSTVALLVQYEYQLQALMDTRNERFKKSAEQLLDTKRPPNTVVYGLSALETQAK